MQQYLPFTVLKPSINISCSEAYCVATVLTVYGIETIPDKLMNDGEGLVELQQYLPFTVLKLDDLAGRLKYYYGCNSTYRLRY